MKSWAEYQTGTYLDFHIDILFRPDTLVTELMRPEWIVGAHFSLTVLQRFGNHVVIIDDNLNLSHTGLVTGE